MNHRAVTIAGQVISTAIQRGSFRAAELEFSTEISASTRSRILRQLEADGWLQRPADTPQSSIWQAGPKAKELGDMSVTALERADDPILSQKPVYTIEYRLTG